ncbi:endosome/lysosome-associated apoptosis and autophagy regulator 1 isoform X2 [Engystomops pustulosus]|uniref:endosome/lysosome-associated apoptosis and autophagy regulator 1 isoform X2 n=1 Tax=Engystomops pustulosus TaxID=76066 RepID=UPI003AFA30A8
MTQEEEEKVAGLRILGKPRAWSVACSMEFMEELRKRKSWLTGIGCMKRVMAVPSPPLNTCLYFSLMLFNLGPLQGQQLHACKESEYHYEYTECDSKGTRWRVAVPHTPGLCTGLPDPVKGTECSFSCAEGQFLDMDVQECTPCGKGTYSLGTGVHFEEWTELPHGFRTFSNNIYGKEYGNCSMSQWEPREDYVASNTDECTATLMYSVNLKQEGTISFEYLYPDSNIAFEFFVQNNQCQHEEDNSRWMRTTEKGWNNYQVKLTQGTNVLYWKTTAFYMGTNTFKPVLLRNILITGAAYTSECFPCKPGTFAPSSGASFCQPCPPNTFSLRAASFCMPCESAKYSAAGSAYCTLRPPCTDKDYFYTHTPCDSNGETQLIYKWVEPKICNETMKDAEKLPVSGNKIKCPPCNPGFHQSNSTICEPCPQGMFSNGTSRFGNLTMMNMQLEKERAAIMLLENDCIFFSLPRSSPVCRECPVGTQAMQGFEYKWWNTLPSNMQSTVMSGLNFEYQQVSGWEVAGDYIYTSAGSSDNDYMILTMNIPAYSSPQKLPEDEENNEVSCITFVFDMKCSENCQLFFMKAVNFETSLLIASWNGTRNKQSYSHNVKRNANTTFTWAFQRTSIRMEGGRQYTADVAKIYSINITNTKEGVASWCQPCALGTDSQCISCPSGHYIDKKTSQCISCPENTYLPFHSFFGEESCAKCGPGLKNNNVHSLCFNDCHFTLSLGGKKLQYDFSLLQNITTFTGNPSFTTKGIKFYHQFSISLCGNQGRKLATCSQNVSKTGLSENEPTTLNSYVCQSINIPSDEAGQNIFMSSQPVVLGDQLIGVTTETTLEKITSPVDLFPGEHKELKDIIFYYRSKEVTQSCPTGRATTIRLRCNPQKSGVGTLSVPSNCSEGTCDGCIFHFLWETEESCPVCTANDFYIITSVCQHGIQRSTAVWQTPHLCVRGIALPTPTFSICKTQDFWLRIGVIGGICTALVLTVFTGYFWKKNRNLEYKYSRLMMNVPIKDGELPSADSCAIMEGEDAEDELLYSTRHSILRKFISFAEKRTSDGFDCVPLKSSEEHIDM